MAATDDGLDEKNEIDEDGQVAKEEHIAGDAAGNSLLSGTGNYSLRVDL